MLYVVTQSGQGPFRLEYFYIDGTVDSEGGRDFRMKGLIRIDLETTELIELGEFVFFKQAIEVFSAMDRISNDLLYYRTNQGFYEIPPAIVSEQECLRIYGSLY